VPWQAEYQWKFSTLLAGRGEGGRVMDNGFGVSMTLWNILTFLLFGVALAILIVLLLRWLSKPDPPQPPHRRSR
jgi:hypothetical protein